MSPNSSETTVIYSEVSAKQNDIEEIKVKIRQKYKCFLGEFETPLIWTNLIAISAFHLITLYSFFTFSYAEGYRLLIYGTALGILGGFGITGGAHRYWTHRSYKAKLPLKLILLFCYSLAGQNSLKDWVRDHRVHHKFSETDADPHNSKRGFLFAHVGWLCMRKHPEVLRRGRLVDISDLFEDPIVAFHIKYWNWFKVIFCFLLPVSIPPLLWGESWKSTIYAIAFARYALNLNFTWSVNSAAHLWGNKPYDKNISPVENKVVSLVAMGEGWHNYHHTFPWDYRAAELGRTLNLTTRFLDFFEKIGWAYSMKSTTPEMIKRVAEKRGDGTHEFWGKEMEFDECQKLAITSQNTVCHMKEMKDKDKSI